MKKTALIASLLTLVALAGNPALGQTIRGHGTHSGRRVIVRSHPRFFFSYSYFPYAYAPFGYGFYGAYPGYPAYGSPYGGEVAFVDTDITPEGARVYVDGEYLGVADDFDGFPTYLPLEPGRHTITFKADGYLTVNRRIRVPRGAVLDLDFTMARGSSRLSPDSEPEGGEEIIVPDREPGPASEDVPEEAPDESLPADTSEPGFIRLKVAPADSSVYIDGDLYGSGSTVNGLHGDLRLEPGRHRIEVVRPGFRPVSRVVEVKPGGRSALTITLVKD